MRFVSCRLLNRYALQKARLYHSKMGVYGYIPDEKTHVEGELDKHVENNNIDHFFLFLAGVVSYFETFCLFRFYGQLNHKEKKY